MFENGDRGLAYPKAHDYVSDGIPFINATHLVDGTIVPDPGSLISDSAFRRLRAGRVRRGDTLFCLRGSPGKLAMVQEPPGAIASSLVIIRANPGVDQRFLHYALSSPDFQRLVKAVDNGSAQPNVSVRALRGLPVPVPPLAHQEAIAAVLGALDDKIELNRRMNETHERIVEIQFTERFANSAIANGEHVPVSTLFTIVSGGTPKTSVEAYWDGTIPWFSVVDTPSGGDVFVVRTDKAITEAGLASSPARLVDPWTTIISARGTVGNLALAAEPMTFNQSCYGLVATEATGPVFVHQLAKRVVERLRAMAHGSVFSTITRSTFDAVTFPSPNPNEVEVFEALARPMYERILTAVRESATLADLRDTLLPKLISGELRIPDAERLVSEVT